MLPIHTVLCPVDFSEEAKAAFEVARALAVDYGARIIVAHIVEPPEIMGTDGGVFPHQIDWEALRNRVIERFPADARIPNEYIVAEGSIVTEIVRMVQEYHVNVIVIGTHGRSGVSRLILGSVAEQVLRHAPCPVVTVKQPQRLARAFSTGIAEPVATPAAAANGGTRS